MKIAPLDLSYIKKHSCSIAKDMTFCRLQKSKPSLECVLNNSIFNRLNLFKNNKSKASTDSEFYIRLKTLEDRIPQLDKKVQISAEKILHSANKTNMDLIDKILSNEPLANNNEFLFLIRPTLESIYSYDDAKIKSMMLDKILNLENSCPNEISLPDMVNIIINTKTQKQLDIQSKAIDRILREEKLHKSKSFIRYAHIAISNLENEKQLDNIFKLLDKILNNEELSNNEDFMKYLAFIMYSCDSNSQIQLKSELIDKILSDKKYLNNPNFAKYAGVMVYLVNSPKQAEFAKTILKNEKLYGNPEFMEHIEKHLYNIEAGR